jgi:MFS family permease
MSSGSMRVADPDVALTAAPIGLPRADRSPAKGAATAPRNRGAAVRGWLAGGSVYSAAVLNRTSLGVAGLAALHRFGISPAQLSIFVILQLGVYAAMQVPTGVLVDAFGSRRLLLVASTVVAIAGLLFAFAPNYPTALFARALLGCGDAMTYISVLRYAGANFSPRRFPHVIALTGMFGFVATLAATVPLSLLLHAAGWQLTFSITAIVPVLAGLAVWFAMPPVHHRQPAKIAPGPIIASVRAAWRCSGTRLGFWVHFSSMSCATAFAVLWGLPYLVATGFSNGAASGLLLMCVVVAVVVSFGVGTLTARRPIVRVPIAFGSCAVTVIGWALLLALGGDHPDKVGVALLVAVLAVGPPVSAIAFMLARDYNPPAIGGTATGAVNCAGFLATIACAAVIGGVLEIAGSTGPGAFRLAMAAAIAIQAFGTFRVAVWWRRVRADVLQQQADGRTVPIRLVSRRWDRPLAGEHLVTGAPRAGARETSVHQDASDLAQ